MYGKKHIGQNEETTQKIANSLKDDRICHDTCFTLWIQGVRNYYKIVTCLAKLYIITSQNQKTSHRKFRKNPLYMLFYCSSNLFLICSMIVECQFYIEFI